MLNWTDYDCTHSFPNVLSCYFQQISRPLRSFWNHIDLLNVIWYIAYLYYNTVLVVSVILFVGYKNHLTVVQFKNQAHIWNPHGTGQVFKTILGTVGTPNLFPHSFVAAEGGGFLNERWRDRSLGGRGNPAEGGCFTSIYIHTPYMLFASEVIDRS